MLYLGHFSFSQDMRQPDRSVEPWHGHFTTVAEARDRETAVKKLRRLVRRLASAEMFEGVGEVYLDDCVEIRSVPAGGFLSHFSSRAGEDLGGIWTAIRGAKPHQATAFDLEPAADDEDVDRVPFVVFGRKLRLVRRAR